MDEKFQALLFIFVVVEALQILNLQKENTVIKEAIANIYLNSGLYEY